MEYKKLHHFLRQGAQQTQKQPETQPQKWLSIREVGHVQQKEEVTAS